MTCLTASSEDFEGHTLFHSLSWKRAQFSGLGYHQSAPCFIVRNMFIFFFQRASVGAVWQILLLIGSRANLGAGRIFLSCLVTCYVAYFVFFFFERHWSCKPLAFLCVCIFWHGFRQKPLNNSRSKLFYLPVTHYKIMITNIYKVDNI